LALASGQWLQAASVKHQASSDKLKLDKHQAVGYYGSKQKGIK